LKTFYLILRAIVIEIEINQMKCSQGSFRTMGNKYQIIGSQKSGARFGTTVVSLGDINLDGYDGE